MSNKGYRMMKFTSFFSFGVRHLFSTCPLCPEANLSKIHHADECYGYRFAAKHFAGQAGILRFTFEFLPMLALKFFHTSCDSFHPFPAIFVGSGKGDPETPVPVFSERSARDHSHASVI